MTLGNTAMGSIQTENLNMLVEELKSEKMSLMNSQIVMTTDSLYTKVDIESNDLINIAPSCSNNVSNL